MNTSLATRVRLMAVLLVTGMLTALAGCGSGTSHPVLVALSGPLTFNTVTVRPSAPATVSITNSGLVPVQIQSVAITGTTPADFTEADACKGSLGVGASCAVR